MKSLINFLYMYLLNCLFSVVGAVSYNGNLVSFMTNPLLLEPIDTPTKILEEGVQVGMYNYQGSTTLAFKSTTNPEYKQIWADKQWITSFGDSYQKSITGMKKQPHIISVVSRYINFRGDDFHGLPLCIDGCYGNHIH